MLPWWSLLQWSACKSKTEALYLDAGGTRLREVDVFKGMFAASRSADVYSAAGIFNSFSPVLLPSCGGKKRPIFNSGLNIRNTHEKTFRDGSWGAVCKEWGSAPGNKPYLQVFFMVIEGGLWHETASSKLLQHLNHFTVNLFTLVCARAMWMEPIQSTSDVFAWLGWFVKPGVKTVN